MKTLLTKLLPLCVLAGCVTTKPLPMIPQNTNVVVTREAAGVWAPIPYRLYVDNDPTIHELSNGGTLFLSLTPGPHIIRTRMSFHGWGVKPREDDAVGSAATMVVNVSEKLKAIKITTSDWTGHIDVANE